MGFFFVFCFAFFLLQDQILHIAVKETETVSSFIRWIIIVLL